MVIDVWSQRLSEASVIVPVSPGAKLITSGRRSTLASATAWRRLPGPVSLRLVTMKFAPRAVAGTLAAAAIALAASARGPALDFGRALIRSTAQRSRSLRAKSDGWRV